MVTISLAVGGGALHVVIADDGVGMRRPDDGRDGGLGLAIIAGLATTADWGAGPSGGVSLSMTLALAA